jgi:hypothetical protein
MKYRSTIVAGPAPETPPIKSHLVGAYSRYPPVHNHNSPGPRSSHKRTSAPTTPSPPDLCAPLSRIFGSGLANL